MKKVIVILAIFLFGLNAYSRELDPYWDAVKIVPQYKEYFEDFAQRLYDNFQPRKHFIGVNGTIGAFELTIFRDGTVKNVQKDFIIKRNKYVDYCEKILMELEPKPFPPEIKDEFIIVKIWLSYLNEDGTDIRLYSRTKSSLYFYWQNLYHIDSVNLIYIYVDKKNYLHKPW